MSFEQALALVVEAFCGLRSRDGGLRPHDGGSGLDRCRPSDHRRSGAYSTEYADPPEPRVFLTFEGTMDNVITLAHELGHRLAQLALARPALSSATTPGRWRRPPPSLPRPWVRDALLAATDRWSSARPSPGWTGRAASLLLDIPARFTFERPLVAAREQGYVGAGQLREMMKSGSSSGMVTPSASMTSCSGPARPFLHRRVRVLQLPYLFGYLFSLGLYMPKRRGPGGRLSRLSRPAARYRAA